jgi:formate dehydrogenase iron-sulfur subunit
MGIWGNQLSGPTDPAEDAGWADGTPRKGFFTDTSICIGCKACEVACKEWNAIPEDGLGLLGSSYDNTGALGASTWRHVAFIEQDGERIAQARESGRRLVDRLSRRRQRDPPPRPTWWPECRTSGG